MRRLRAPTLEGLFIGTYALFGFRGGAVAINDNSMFVHVRTGVDMVAHGAIPRHDPYSFTAHGQSWVVQSWLAEWTYGWLNRLGGTHLIVLEQAVLMATVATLTGRLARAGTPLRTAAATGVALGAGALLWSQRPLMFGLVSFALLVLVVERRRSPWWLVPVVWVWVNSHGSFPLGLVWLGAVVVGLSLDTRRLSRELFPYIGTFLLGLVVSAVNPLGPRLILFPLTVEQKHKVFATVTEWMSPNFQTPLGLVTLASLVVALLVLIRRPRPWADVVPFVVFLAMGVIALRNLPVASIAFAPVLGRAFRAETDKPDERTEAELINVIFAAGLAAVALLSWLVMVRQDGVSEKTYPSAAVRYMERTGLLSARHRVAEQDIVGCYLILLRGTHASVFIDDRFDMYPTAVSNDYDTLLHGFPGALEVLDARSIDVVLWDGRQPLVGLLAASGHWERRYQKAGWDVWTRS